MHRPMHRRVARLTEMDFGIGLWAWPDDDLGRLDRVTVF